MNINIEQWHANIRFLNLNYKRFHGYHLITKLSQATFHVFTDSK